MRNVLLMSAVAALGWVTSPLAAQAQTRYRMTVLPDLPADIAVSSPQALNDRGEAVGFSRNLEGVLKAVIWSRDGSIRVLDPDPGPSRSEAFGLNNRSEAVGNKLTSPGSQPFGQTAFLWERQGPLDLGDLPAGRLFSDAQDINNASEIVGQACNDAGCFAFRSGPDRALQVLPALSGSPANAGAHAINDRGEIVGFSAGGPTGRGGPVLWREGELIQLPSLPGSDPGGQAVDINNRGQIVGTSANRPALWDNDQVGELPRLPGYTAVFTMAINDSGTIVGGAVLTLGGAERAIAWEDGAMVDLEELTDRQPGQPDADRLPLTIAVDINEAGQILVLARDTNSEINASVAVVLTPED